MSREAIEWLNTMTLIGQTDRRGVAWHYREDLQAGMPNHYAGAIPLEDVRGRLFTWNGVMRRVAVEVPARDFEEWTHTDDEGRPMRWAVIDDKMATDRSDRISGEVFGVVSPDYKLHQYSDWLLSNVTHLLGDDLSISSAGLLKAGAIAWVELSVPENRMAAEGVEFRPNLLATTSMDGTSATIYKRTITDVVCDNTRAVALREKGAQIKVRHSKYSDLRIDTAYEALQLIEEATNDFTKQVSELVDIKVNGPAWEKFLAKLVPFGAKNGGPDSDYVRSLKEKKREDLDFIYRNDPRCAPWQDTAHGVIQAVNTWEHHVRLPQKKSVAESKDQVAAWRRDQNSARTVAGTFAEKDRETFELLVDVLGIAA